MYQTPPPAYPQSGGPLQPLGTLFSRTLQILRTHPTVFIGLAALQVIPQLLLSIYLTATGISLEAEREIEVFVQELERRLASSPGDAQVLQGMPWGLSFDATSQLLGLSLGLVFLSSFVLRSIAIGGSVIAVGDTVREDAKPSFGAALSGALKHAPALIGWSLIAALFTFGLTFLILIPCLGVLIWGILLIFLAVRMIFVPIVIVAEQAGIMQAISRSWQLTKHMFWRVFGAILLFSVLISIATSLITTIFQVFTAVMFGGTSGLTIAVGQGFDTMLSLFALPIAYIGFTLLYYDHQRNTIMMAPPPPPPSYQPPHYE